MMIIRGVTRLARVAAVVLALPLAACDELLDVTDPDTVVPGSLEDPAFVDVLVAGAISDFAVAYSGGEPTGLNDSFLAVTAAMSDEFHSTGTFTTRTATDRRLQFTPANGNTSDLAYTELQQARRSLKFATQKVEEFVGTSDPAFAEVAALHAYTYVALGEAFCSSIPISDDVDPSQLPREGPPLTSQQLFEASLALFDQAGSTHLANLGKARALVNLGRYAEAAQLVAGVPDEFNYFIEHSSNSDREHNPIFALQDNGRWSLSHVEGMNGVPFRGSDPNSNSGQDPRIPWFEDPDGGFDPVYRLFVVRKYPSRDSDVVLASGVEARLIEAEAALASGGNWLAILNALRADVGPLMAAQIDNYSAAVPSPALAPLSDPGTPAARVNMLFQERAFWMWGTGHRLGDLRRLMNQYGRTETQVFPTGGYHKGGSYGTDVVFPVDFDESNNSLYDIGTCVVGTASIG